MEGFVLLKLVIPIWALIFLAACTRAKNPQSSIIIKTPTRDELLKSGVSTFNEIEQRKVCYGVNIYGVGISEFNNGCSPRTGVVSGFVEGGQSLEAVVNRGSDRTVELFVFLLPLGDSGACPTLGQNLNGTNATSTYLVGKVQNVNLINDTEIIPITVNFPGLQNHIALPYQNIASCGLPTPTTESIGSTVTSGGGTAVSADFILKGKIGKAKSGTTAIGGGFILNGNVTQ